MAKVAIQIVTWNSQRYIGQCLQSVLDQSFEDYSVMVIDNDSSDNTVSFIRAEYPTVPIFRNSRNLGFAKAHNQGIKLAQAEYVLVLNPDIVLPKNFLQIFIDQADNRPEAGSFCPKLLKLKSQAIDENDQGGWRELVPTNIIDAAGLTFSKTRQALNRGEGEEDTGQYDEQEPIFGSSGACVLYRKSILEKVKIKDEYFDEDFFAYKEDVDLSWRLQLNGYSCWYIPTAVAYHHRGLPKPKKEEKILSRQKVSKKLRAWSLRNHFWMLLKNEQWSNIFFTAPWFFARQFGLILFSIFAEPFQIKTLGDCLKGLPKMFVKRRMIKKQTVVSAKMIRKWMK
jgi:GT2 family glycosyltransferase